MTRKHLPVRSILTIVPIMAAIIALLIFGLVRLAEHLPWSGLG